MKTLLTMADSLRRQEEEQARYERYLPICDICGERINDDEYYVVGGKVVCQQCCEVHSTAVYADEQIDAEGMDDYEDDLPFC